MATIGEEGVAEALRAVPSVAEPDIVEIVAPGPRGRRYFYLAPVDGVPVLLGTGVRPYQIFTPHEFPIFLAAAGGRRPGSDAEALAAIRLVFGDSAQVVSVIRRCALLEADERKRP